LTSRHGLEIRAANGGDAPGLALLLAEAGLGIAPRPLAARLEMLRQGAGTALLALEWGPPSGVVALHWYPTLLDDRPTAQITLLLVGAESRRRGIGRLLIKAAAQAARTAGCGALELAVASAEPSLAAFCRATGFLDAGPCFTRSLRKQA
jgi:GNAT superfamily N-acetyltransferase